MANLGLPPDTSLPFLIYDIFNPPKSRINRINEIESIMDTENIINKIVPVKLNNKRHAYVVYFNEDNSDDAYNLIGESQSEDYYEWSETEINEKRFNVIIKKLDNDREKFLDIPKIEDRKLPFFAYGVFKKGQLAHSEIKKYICEIKQDQKVEFKMGIRDGIPILLYGIRGLTIGDLIYFNEEDCEDAYETISSTRSKKLYKWEKIKIKNGYANVIVGKDVEKGTSDMIPELSYDSFDDYFFSDAINLIEKELIDYDDATIESFFHLQMNYLLLWVVIERFCILKYGLNKPYVNRENFAGEKMFKDCLKQINRNNIYIYSSKDLQIHQLNKEKPYESIEYYYTIRCNVAHRGKNHEYVKFDSNQLIYNSLKELIYIFKEVLNDSFERDIFQKKQRRLL